MGWGGRLLTFSAFRMGAYSRWALIRGWALIRINTVCTSICPQSNISISKNLFFILFLFRFLIFSLSYIVLHLMSSRFKVRTLRTIIRK